MRLVDRSVLRLCVVCSRSMVATVPLDATDAPAVVQCVDQDAMREIRINAMVIVAEQDKILR